MMTMTAQNSWSIGTIHWSHAKSAPSWRVWWCFSSALGWLHLGGALRCGGFTMHVNKKAGVRQVWALLLCVSFFGLAGLFETEAQPVGVQQHFLTQNVHGNPGFLLVSEEFRIVIANLMWTNVVDHYHHVYIAQGGDWSKNVTLLPLLRTITELNPHFTQAYQLEGGTILPRTGRIAEGRAVLEEGLKNNPNSWEMYREIAMLYAWTERKPALALPYAEKGLQYANDGFSRNLLGMLCKTLRDQVAAKSAVTAAERQPPAQNAQESSAIRELPPPLRV
jgi:hypothetical protein